jgi:ABC-type uncharacterized transport system ATPase subunit
MVNQCSIVQKLLQLQGVAVSFELFAAITGQSLQMIGTDFINPAQMFCLVLGRLA